MFKSTFFFCLCLAVVAAKSKSHTLNEPIRKTESIQSLGDIISLTNNKAVESCDVQEIKQLAGQIISLTSDTLDSVIASVVAAVLDLAYCIVPTFTIFCLASDVEYAFLDNLREIVITLGSYMETAGPLFLQIGELVESCKA